MDHRKHGVQFRVRQWTADPLKLAFGAGLAVGGGAASDEMLGSIGLDTTGMTSIQQAERFAPRVAAFVSMSPNAAGVVGGDVLGNTLGGVIDYLYSQIQPQIP